MSFLLFGAGAIAVVAGAAMVGFGIPVSEFSFGNTLIVAGMTAVVGGLIVIGLGAAVLHLRRISEALANRAPVRAPRPMDMFEPGAARAVPAPARVPFPPKPKAETAMREPAPPEPRAAAPLGSPFKDHHPETFAPTLPNPDEPPVTVEDDVSLSPQHPTAGSAPAPADFDEPARQAPPPSFDVDRSEPSEMRDEQPELDAGWHAPPPTQQPHATFFDTMWPAEPKPAKAAPAHEEAPEPEFEQTQETASAPAEHAEHAEPPHHPEDEPRAVAILKSGVVDGMGYTLYVDGSIEAELPHGTLRFASINELRSHLEKTS